MIMLEAEDSCRKSQLDAVDRSAADRAEELQIPEQLVSLVAPGSFAADQYRSLRHIVERLHNESDIHVLAVTSPTPGDGKTVTTLNLAGALAQAAESRVLLIDADLRKPSVAEYLPFGPGRPLGLVDAIVDPDARLTDVVRRFDRLNLSVVPARCADTGTYELLTSPRLGMMLADARRLYDYVLIDTPPLVPVPDCRLIGRWVDGFLIVVAAHKTPRRLLGEGLNLIEPAKAIGMVFNFDNRPFSGYHGYYGYGYGYGAYSQRTPGRRGWLRRLLPF